jgi:ribosomal-protein-alanine N-acetyltransferase
MLLYNMNALFQSERLLFRQFTLQDAALLIELNSDPEVLKYVHEPATTEENAPDILKNIILPQYELGLGRWAVHLKYSLEFIGWAGLKYISERDEIDLGYRFKKQYWGRGYATEAANTCINYGFVHLDLGKITAKAHEENTASLNVIEKCGMQFLKQDVIDGSPVKVYELVNHSREAHHVRVNHSNL